MNKALLTALTVISIVLGAAVFMIDTPSTLAAAKDDVCEGIGAVGGGCGPAAGEPTVGSVIKTVIGILSTIIGVISVIMIIVGGFKYVTSAGDSGNVTSAKNTIIYAIVGLVVAFMAQIIVKFVLEKIG